jgi:RecB family exonuclease
MASRKTVTAKNLEALGTTRLAELLIETSAGNAAARRRLRLELAAAQSPAEVAKEVRKRLATIARSRALVDWQKRRELVDDLESQRRAIVD